MSNSVDETLSNVVLPKWGTPKHMAREADPLAPTNETLSRIIPRCEAARTRSWPLTVLQYEN